VPPPPAASRPPYESDDDSTRGIIDVAAGLERFSLQRFEPSPELTWAVHRYWTVAWDLPAGEQHDQRVVPHVAVHLVFERGAANLEVINQSDFVRNLVGCSHVFGVKFRPASFRPFIDRPVAEISNRRMPAAPVLGPEVDAVAAELDAASPPGPGDRRADAVRVDAYLRSLDVAPLKHTHEVNDIVELIEADRTITRVDQLAARVGTSARSLQRLFADHVGQGPKWVIGRFRLLDAVDAADGDEPVRWADVAADLGYSDQAHLVRTFNHHVGVPPGTYSRR
jgi:AraC-like DNA-binding protein